MDADPAIFEEDDVAADEATDADAIAELQRRPAVAHERMKAWLQSWGTSDELAPPNEKA